MSKEIDYKLFYKPEETIWKHFYFEAEDDDKAKEFAENWVKKNHISRYGIEKITKERIV